MKKKKKNQKPLAVCAAFILIYHWCLRRNMCDSVEDESIEIIMRSIRTCSSLSRDAVVPMKM